MTRLLWLGLLAGAFSGCNAVLGIDEARLDPGDAGPDAGFSSASSGAAGSTSSGAGGAGGGSMDAGCSLRAPDPCNKCVADKCCAQFEACNSDITCKAALTAYNMCVGLNFTNDAGGTCDEDFSLGGGDLQFNLGSCALSNGATASPSGCADVCHREPLGGEICSVYCKCLDDICPEKMTDSASCVATCGAFTPEQLRCRPYHCENARRSSVASDDNGRRTHCGHAVGEALCP